MNRQVAKYFQLKAKHKEIEQELAELRQSIVDYCEQLGVTETTVGHFEVKLVKQERKEYDDTKLYEALPDPQVWRLLSKPDLARISSLIKLRVLSEEQLKHTFALKQVTLLQVEKK